MFFAKSLKILFIFKLFIAMLGFGQFAHGYEHMTNEQLIKMYNETFKSSGFKKPKQSSLKQKFPDQKKKDSSSRNPAANCSDTKIDYPCMTEDIRTLKDKKGVKKLLTKLSNAFKKEDKGTKVYQDNESKLLAAQLLVLLPYEGILHRSKKIVDQYEGENKRGAKVVHSVILTGLRKAGETFHLSTDFPMHHAVYDFVTRSGSKAPLKSENAFNDFQVNEVLDHVKRVVTVAKAIAKELQKSGGYLTYNAEVLFDEKVNEKDPAILRYMGTPEVNGLIAQAELLIAGILMTAAYESHFLEILSKFNEKIALDPGFTGILRVDGLNGEERTNIVRGAAKLNLRSDGKKKMSDAWEHIKASVTFAAASYTGSLNRRLSKEDEEHFALASQYIEPFRRIGDSGFVNAGIQISGTVNQENSPLLKRGGSWLVKSQITGQTTRVNPEKFFKNPPKDLKRLLPKSFEIRGPKKFEDGSRNYAYKVPNSWHYSEFAKFSSDIKDSKSLKRTVRIIAQSTVGGIVAPVIFWGAL